MAEQRHVKTMLSVLSVLIAGAIMTTYLMTSTLTAEEQGAPGRKMVLLMGASVGKAWNLKEWPERTHNNSFNLESIAFYKYDKTETLEEILMRPKRKFRLTRTYLKGFFKPAPQLPEIIILKECAAYFPGDLSTYQSLIKQWVGQIRGAGIPVMLATIVPVTRTHQTTHAGRIESIRAYNDWIRSYAAQERLPLLDLEAAVRIDDTTRFLRDDLTSGDGLHLNKQAYDILDRVLQETLTTTATPQAA
jgi:hypothetical protein